MFIVPISSSTQPVESLFDNENEKASEIKEDAPKFSDVFKEIFNEMQDTQKTLEEDAVRLTMGEIDDLLDLFVHYPKFLPDLMGNMRHFRMINVRADHIVIWRTLL